MKAGLAAGVAISAVLVACAAAHKSAVMAPTTADAGLPTGRADHSEIERLAAEIDQKLEGKALPPFDGEPVPFSTLPVCKPPASDTCTTACTLSDAICDNAQKICNLAGQLPGDAWAKDKCDDSTKKCDAAHKACCDCT